MFNYFATSGLVISIVNLALAVLITLNSKRKIHKIWSYVNYSISFWGVGIFVCGVSQNHSLSILGWKIFNVGIILIAILYYHVTHLFCKLKSNRFLIFSYVQGVLFICLVAFTNLMFGEKLIFSFDQFYYFKATLIHHISMIAWTIIVGKSFFELYKHINSTTGIKKIQAKYLFIAMLFGFGGGLNTAPAAWGFEIYPYGQILVCFYGLCTSYAIFRYHLMDVNIVITRLGLFACVYSIVLGFPFVIAFGREEKLTTLIGSTWWIVPLLSSTFLAIIGPYIYLHLQRKAEDRLLSEQRQYQSTLSQASIGMGQIKELDRLLKLVVHIVTKTVHIEHCEVYLYDQAKDAYVLKAFRSKKNMPYELKRLEGQSELIENLKNKKEPLVCDEVKQYSQDYEDEKYKTMEKMLGALNAELIVPSFIEQKLIAIFVLGKKLNGRPYSDDDLAVFSILANQSGLAIENALYLEDMKQTQERLFKAEKMATIGTMADGLSHQINNRLHAMGFIAGDALDSIKIEKPKDLASETEEIFQEIERALERIKTNVVQGGEIVGGLLKYTKETDLSMGPVDLHKILKSSFEMLQYKIKLKHINIFGQFNEDLPKVKGNATQLQEVFFNIIDNSYDAMMQRKNDLREPDYKPSLFLSAKNDGKNIEVMIKDNGMGVKKEDYNKLFTPFFTTKLTGRKGTGLGLYVIRQIVEDNHRGKVEFISEHKKGSQTRLLLPLAKEALQNIS